MPGVEPLRSQRRTVSTHTNETGNMHQTGIALLCASELEATRVALAIL